MTTGNVSLHFGASLTKSLRTRGRIIELLGLETAFNTISEGFQLLLSAWPQKHCCQVLLSSNLAVLRAMAGWAPVQSSPKCALYPNVITHYNQASPEWLSAE